MTCNSGDETWVIIAESKAALLVRSTDQLDGGVFCMPLSSFESVHPSVATDLPWRSASDRLPDTAVVKNFHLHALLITSVIINWDCPVLKPANHSSPTGLNSGLDAQAVV